MSDSLWASTSNPKAKLEWLVDLVAFLAAYYFLFIYQGIFGLTVPFISFQNLIAVPIVAIVIIPLIHYTLVLPDPLQRSPGNGTAIRFFQSEFPSRYLLKRCELCTESAETCPAYLRENEGDYLMIWFKQLFQGELKRQHPEWITDTFGKGYTCRLVYYVQRILGVFMVASLVTLSVNQVLAYLRTKVLALEATPLQLASLLGGSLLLALVHFLNKPCSERPSGCWQAWREINRMSVAWMKNNHALLNSLVCQRDGGKKEYKGA